MTDTLYTVTHHGNNGEITTGLTAREAAAMVIGNDRRAWEIRCEADSEGLIDGRAWIQEQATGTWRKTVYFAVSCESEAEAEAEVIAKIIADEHDNFRVETDADHIAEQARLAAEDAEAA
jgi:hypothetical protein